MVRKKHLSKRQTLKDKYKIQRKVREHHRKLRKEAKKNPQKRKKFKDPGLPNNYPLKHQLLQQIAKEEETAKDNQRQENIVSLKRKRDREENKNENNEEKEIIDEESFDENVLIISEFKDIISQSDIVFEVIDARDPIGTRSKNIEKQIQEIKPDIKIVLVLNKIDLVPRRVVENWIKYLRKDLPLIVFKSDNQINSETFNSIFEIPNFQFDCIGDKSIFNLLKQYYATLEIKRPIISCVVGFPSVGKSTILNNLKRSRILTLGYCPPNFEEEEDYSEKKFVILDTPSYLIDPDRLSQNELVLYGFMDIVDVNEPIEPIQEIIKRCTKEKLSEIYKIGEFDDELDFLSQVAKKKGKYTPEGPDTDIAIQLVAKDWITGGIPFYTTIPKSDKTKSVNFDNSWIQNIIDPIYKLESSNIQTLKDDVYKYLVFEGVPNNIELDMNNNSNKEEINEEIDEIIDDVKEKTIPNKNKPKTNNNVEEDDQHSLKKRKSNPNNNNKKSIKPPTKTEPSKAKKSNQIKGSNEDYNFNEFFGDN
jgi:nuclear GTP-binding protein